FFSSRRRHTRFSRDWSSDVCSSDLLQLSRDISPCSVTGFSFAPSTVYADCPTPGYISEGVCYGDATYTVLIYLILLLFYFDFYRSEERRVGKECRCRWAPHQYAQEQ